MSTLGTRHGDEAHNKYDATIAKSCRKMWLKGFTLKEISASYGVSVTTITRWLSKNARGELE